MYEIKGSRNDEGGEIAQLYLDLHYLLLDLVLALNSSQVIDEIM